LWWTGESPAKFGPVEEGELPVDIGLWEKLTSWAEEMDATFNRHDPLESGFSDPDKRTLWDRHGFDLWMALREQLGGTYHIRLFHENEWLNPEDFPVSNRSDE